MEGLRIPRNEVVDLGEYKIIINYDGDGGLDIVVLDELEEEIEGIYISNDDGEITNEDVHLN